jgi:formylglycine-generating enzyme required for sulfatase activity
MKRALFVIATLLVCFSSAVADNSWSEGADINGEGLVDYKDSEIMAKYWLATDPNTTECNVPDITWVYIEDPGIGGYKGFTGYMSKYETTNAQFAKYLNSAKASGAVTVSANYVIGSSGPYSGQNYYRLDGSGCTYDGATNDAKSRISYSGGSFTVDAGFGDHPVTSVSWYGASAFASYYGWRLPTEWEWQAVADYDGSYVYGCGPKINNSIANYYGSYHPHGTTPVGQYGLFGYGMADMAGNVCEWTSSLWDPAHSYRVFRGGSWYNFADFCAVSARLYDLPFTMTNYLGFRVCR